MRVIEQETINAIRSIAAGTRSRWQKANMSAEAQLCPWGFAGSVVVRLHGNPIARLGHDMTGQVREIALSDGGWQTVTTKSRLNAIASEFGIQGVYQRQFQWFMDNGDSFCDWSRQEVNPCSL